MARLARVVVPGYPHHNIGEAHRRYTRRVNFREGWRGHLWQGRFSFFVMDNKYLMAAVRYVAMNPGKSGLAKGPQLYRWSSAAAYLCGKDDPLVSVSGLNEMIDNWPEFFEQGVDSEAAEKMRKHEKTGRPLGSENFVVKMEKILDRMLRPKKPGRKPKKRTPRNVMEKRNRYGVPRFLGDLENSNGMTFKKNNDLYRKKQY